MVDGSTRFGAFVDVGGRDEFAKLGTSFNQMASELQHQMVELEAERRRLRAATARFGDALEATHDVEQLLRVIVGTAVEVTPIRSVDRIKVGRGRRGPVTEAIQQKFFQIVKGEAPDTYGWLQAVYSREAATTRA